MLAWWGLLPKHESSSHGRIHQLLFKYQQLRGSTTFPRTHTTAGRTPHTTPVARARCHTVPGRIGGTLRSLLDAPALKVGDQRLCVTCARFREVARAFPPPPGAHKPRHQR